MSAAPINLEDIDVSKITFSDLKQLSNGGKMIWINYNKGPMYFKMAATKSPWGVSNYDGKLTIQLNLNDACLAKIKEIEERIIDEATKNSFAWLKRKDVSSKIISEMFTSSIGYSKDKTTGEINPAYPPTLKLKVTADTAAFASETEPIVPVNETTITRQSTVTMVGRLSAIYVMGANKTTFGTTYKAESMLVGVPAKIGAPKFLFDDNDC